MLIPTVLRERRYRFCFFSNEGQEPLHIYVKTGGDEAKFWLEPIELVANYGFNARELNQIKQIPENSEQPSNSASVFQYY